MELLATQIKEYASSKETKASLKKFLKSNKISLVTFTSVYNSKFPSTPVKYSSFHYKANKSGVFSNTESANIKAIIENTESEVKSSVA